jgi:hypothetical protein
MSVFKLRRFHALSSSSASAGTANRRYRQREKMMAERGVVVVAFQKRSVCETTDVLNSSGPKL